MTTAPARTAQPDGANPSTDRSGANAAPSRSAHLRGLVQILIAFGKSLLETLQAPLEPQTRFNITCRFGTRDIALIIARIARGLLLAQALDERLVQTAAQLDRPRPAAIKAPCRNIQPVTAKPEPAALSARLPTAQEIAIQVRRQPIGRVIEDICRDLGINPSNEFWHQLQFAILENGGNLARLFKAMLTRISLADLGLSPAMPTPQPIPGPARTGAGPP